jgi:hypothetical protein
MVMDFATVNRFVVPVTTLAGYVGGHAGAQYRADDGANALIALVVANFIAKGAAEYRP